MNPPIVLFGDALISAIAVLATSCVVAYQVTTGGAWRRTWTGRHLMAFMAVLAVLADLGLVRVIAVDLLGQPDPACFQVLRVAVLTLEPFVLAWRLAIIIGASRGASQAPAVIPKEAP